MAVYLNTNKPLQNYESLYKSKYFVDKSLIIEKLNEVLGTSDKYICITRPRRFGKTSIADMLGAYYTKGIASNEVFENLEISKSESYQKHLNKYNVINISFNKIPDDDKSYEEYINMVKVSITNDILEKYPKLKDKKYFTISDMLVNILGLQKKK